MFIILLKFSSNKARAGEFMAGHNAWIDRGLKAGTFLVVGSLQPSAGGAILAHGIARDQLAALVNEDPFVAENIVSAEILEIKPGRTDPRLAFLLS